MVPDPSRRAALAALAAALAAAAAAGAAPAACAATEAAAAMGAADGSADDDSAEFYTQWPARPADILPWIRAKAAPGDAAAVLGAMDAWAARYPMYAIGAEKGALLDQVLSDLRPRIALEIGTFLGYSAIRTARQLAPGGTLICIEANPDNAAVAREVVDYAGVGQRVIILGGLGSDKLPEAARLAASLAAGGGGAAREGAGSGGGGGGGGARVLAGLRAQAAEQRAATEAAAAADGEGASEPEPAAAAAAAKAAAAGPVAGAQVDYLFLDHCKPCYLPDFVAAEALGLVGRGTLVAADNVHLSGGRYATALLDAPHEVDKPWDKAWTMGTRDAVAVSLRW
ncbi:MAG: hypothetical protein J3K34DRAFT_516032 [Monoraphidium minutum]|nr:MAG: hypothetical protein J3K34DRAFT_516032 [Monoraphidium minutum]